MTVISIVIPTVPGRERYLARGLAAYSYRTDEFDLEIIVVRDSPTCGLGWSRGAAQASGDYLHFTADDIVPDFGWAPIAVETVDRGQYPAGSIVVPDPNELTEQLELPFKGAMGVREVFFERADSTLENVPDGYMANGAMGEYAAAPFMSREMWGRMDPMIPTTYGTDKWASVCAERAGYPVVARHGVRFYHYVAHPGRLDVEHGWMHTDLIDFDMNIAYPEYLSGGRSPLEPHPARLTPEGRRLAREWRVANVPPPYPWEANDLPEVYR